MAAVVLASGEAASEVQVDLDSIGPGPFARIEGLPAGPHRLSMLLGETWHHRWLSVPTGGETMLLEPVSRSRTGAARCLRDTGNPADAAGADAAPGRDRGRAPRPARGGVAHMPATQLSRWRALTTNIEHHLPPAEVERPRDARRPRAARGLDCRIDDAGGPHRLLAELERYVLDGFLTPETGDLGALASWRELLGAIGGARPDVLARHPHLFPAAAHVIDRQLAFVGADVLDDGLVFQLDLLVRDLVGSRSHGLIGAGTLLGGAVGA